MLVRDARRHNFFTVDNAVLDKGLSRYALVTYLVLCRYANNDTQTCKVLLATIAKKTGCGRTNVSLAIKELETLGLISVNRTKDSSCVFTLLSVETPIQNTNAPHSNGELPPFAVCTHNNTNNKKTESKATKFTLPIWIDRNEWDAFEEMRTKLRKPMTDRARNLIVGKLERLARDGDTPREVLEQSVISGWSDVYAIKTDFGGGKNGNRQSQFQPTALIREQHNHSALLRSLQRELQGSEENEDQTRRHALGRGDEIDGNGSDA
jgi:hypothetical protein